VLKAVLWTMALVAGTPLAAAPPAALPPPVVTMPPPPAARPAVDAAAMAEARALLHDMDFDGQLESTARRAAESTFDTMLRELQARYGGEVPAELRARVHALLMENVTQLIAEMRPTALDDAARVYARYFTADELREIRRIQTEPVMLKMQRLGPQILPELMQIGVAVSARHMPELAAALRRVVEQWQSEQAARRPHVG
jgi:hypothetical protein